MTIGTLWVPLDWRTITDNESIDGAVANWCADNGVSTPCWGEDHGGDWRLEIPAGTSFEPCPDRPRADALRVTYPNGRTFQLAIDREGDFGGESWREVVYFNCEREVQHDS
jgi:hypothetical protein